MVHTLAVLVGIPLFWHLAAVAGAVYDAGRVGMDPRKWAAVVFLVPLFGLFAYLLERSERTTDADRYDDGTYNIHESADSEPADGSGNQRQTGWDCEER